MRRTKLARAGESKLPIQFNINIRAPFYSLITSLKAMYDPAFVKDPRDLGLIDAGGNAIPRPAPAPAPAPGPSGTEPAIPTRNIQPKESEIVP